MLVQMQMQMQMLATVPTRCMVLLSCCAGAGAAHGDAGAAHPLHAVHSPNRR